MTKKIKKFWRLKPSILTSFVILTVPVFFAIIYVTYTSNDKIARENAQEVIARFKSDAVDGVQREFRAIMSLARAAAALGSEAPDFYEGSKAFPYFQSLVQHSPRIVSAYVGMEDGAFRQTRRIEADVPIHDALPPPNAAYAFRWIVPEEVGETLDHYYFLDADMQPVGGADGPTTYDPRVRLWYKSAAESGDAMLSDPDVFAALGLIGFTVGAPFYVDGELKGVAAIDLTLDGLGAELHDQAVSPRTLSYILDRQGQVIASSDEETTYANNGKKLELRHIAGLDNTLPAVAFSLRPRDGGSETFYFSHEGREYVASLSPLAADLGKQWQIFIITPISDFTSVFRANNERLALFGLIAMLIQIIIVSILTGRLAAPLEQLAVKVDRVQELGIEHLASVKSSIKEVAALSTAVDTLDAAVRSFAAFVPMGLVSQLITSEQKLELGSHSRFLTVFFSDLEGFSTLSEELPTQDLMGRVSDYFELTTRCVDEEFGTIDKFIGDGVMAFWGAPAILDDHAWHSCVAAMRIQRGMDRLNETWAAQDLKTLNIRIGIHSDAVLVGNIGSLARMSYTVMGDGVNIAARLEGVNKEYRTRICISHAVFKEAGERLCVRPIEDVAVKGRRSKIAIYELLGVYGSDDPKLEPTPGEVRLAKRSRDAYRARIAGDITLARQLYKEILDEFEGDTVAEVVLQRLED